MYGQWKPLVSAVKALKDAYFSSNHILSSSEGYWKLVAPIVQRVGFKLGRQNDTEEFYEKLVTALEVEMREDLQVSPTRF